jgi:hypothetical protein
MTSLEATFVTRKGEDRQAEPEGIGGYTASCTQGQNHRKRELNGELWKAAPPYGGNMEGNQNDLRAARKKSNELSSVIQTVRP